MVLEAGSLSPECQQGQVLVRALFLVAADCLLTVSSRDRKSASRFSGFVDGHHPIPEDSTLITYVLKALPSNIITLRLGFPHMNFREAHTFNSQQFN